MRERKVILNAVTSVFQVVASSVILFVLYKYLIKTIGISNFGIWSLIVAVSSMTRIAGLGLEGSIVKYVAKYIALEDMRKVCQVIETAITSVGIIFIPVLLLVYPLIKMYLVTVVEKNALSLALSILPLACVAFWALMVTRVMQAGLDGNESITHRNLILLWSSFSHLILCILFAPQYGLMGVAYARVIQNFMTMIISWIVLKNQIKSLPPIPYRWHKDIILEIYKYTFNIQIISLLTIIEEPVTKGLLTKFGSLSMVGYYEMANRLVKQFRAMIVSANQVLVPAFAHLTEVKSEKIIFIYQASYNTIFFISLFVFSSIIVAAPLISTLWIGQYVAIFISFLILLSVGYYLNLLNVPAFYANLGVGNLRWNVIGNSVNALVNLGCGLLLGYMFGGKGVVFARVIALILGSGIIYISYHIINNIPLSALLPKKTRLLLILCFFSILITYVIQNLEVHSIRMILYQSLMPVTFYLITGFYFWNHPLRKKIYRWFGLLFTR
ncbi:MAG: hypothetical protein ACMUIP_09305 [bacterium]